MNDDVVSVKGNACDGEGGEEAAEHRQESYKQLQQLKLGPLHRQEPCKQLQQLKLGPLHRKEPYNLLQQFNLYDHPLPSLHFFHSSSIYSASIGILGAICESETSGESL